MTGMSDGREHRIAEFPPPYGGMLALSSDVEFTTWPTQVELFAIFGGLGLETAFSFWCFGDPRQTWRLFEADHSLSPHAESAFRLARSGLLDSLHSFGDSAGLGEGPIDRARIANAYEVLKREGVEVPVYSNHGSRSDRQNIGGEWATYQEGDLPHSPCYHLDLTLGYGIRFFWTDPDYDLEWRPGPSSACSDDLFAAQACRDGNRILRFRRYRGRLPQSPCATTVADQLAPLFREGLSGYKVIYQHLGAHRRPDGQAFSATPPLFHDRDLEALRALSGLDRSGRVLVTTTARLLRHAMLMKSRCWKIAQEGPATVVTFPCLSVWQGVPFTLTWKDLEGWCMECVDEHPVLACLGSESRAMACWIVNGVRYAGFPWSRIDVPACVEDALEVTPCRS